jgi:hypothetical protein
MSTPSDTPTQCPPNRCTQQQNNQQPSPLHKPAVVVTIVEKATATANVESSSTTKRRQRAAMLYHISTTPSLDKNLSNNNNHHYHLLHPKYQIMVLKQWVTLVYPCCTFSSFFRWMPSERRGSGVFTGCCIVTIGLCANNMPQQKNMAAGGGQALLTDLMHCFQQ